MQQLPARFYGQLRAAGRAAVCDRNSVADRVHDRDAYDDRNRHWHRHPDTYCNRNGHGEPYSNCERHRHGNGDSFVCGVELGDQLTLFGLSVYNFIGNQLPA